MLLDTYQQELLLERKPQGNSSINPAVVYSHKSLLVIHGAYGLLESPCFKYKVEVLLKKWCIKIHYDAPRVT